MSLLAVMVFPEKVPTQPDKSLKILKILHENRKNFGGKKLERERERDAGF